MPEMLRKSAAFAPRYRKFESISLQRGVMCEPGCTDAGRSLEGFCRGSGEDVRLAAVLEALDDFGRCRFAGAAEPGAGPRFDCGNHAVRKTGVRHRAAPSAPRKRTIGSVRSFSSTRSSESEKSMRISGLRQAAATGGHRRAFGHSSSSRRQYYD